MEPQAECMLVLIGATPEGKKELIGFQVGVRESAQSRRELLVDLKSRGLTIAPELATGDGALGFWKALDAVSPTTRHQRGTVHTIRTNRVVLSGTGPLLPGGGERNGITWRISRRPSPTMMRSITSCKMACFSVRVASAKRLADAIAERRHVDPHRLGLEP